MFVEDGEISVKVETDSHFGSLHPKLNKNKFSIQPAGMGNSGGEEDDDSQSYD